LYRECPAGAQLIFPESGRGIGHVIPTIFGSTVGYPSDSLASCCVYLSLQTAELYEISARCITRYAASHAAKISHTLVTVLTKTERDEFNSVTYVVRNMANDAFDQKFGNQ